MDKKISIIGAGAAGMVTAAWLLQKGYEVTLCDTGAQSAEDFAQVRAHGLTIDGPGFSPSDAQPVMTHDIREAMAAERLIVCVSSGRQQAVAEWMAPHLRASHTILLVPGNFGSVVFHRVFAKKGAACALLAELAECLWACRKTGPGRYVSAMPPSAKRIAALPSLDTARALAAYEDLFALQAGRNILENSLNSPNVITHVPGVLFNLGGIAAKGAEFALFEDGMSDGYLTCMALLEAERDAVLARAGLESFAKPVQPLMDLLLDIDHHPEMRAFRALKGPDSVHHRFIEEDAACGLAMLCSLAAHHHVDVPVADALLTLAGKLTDNDYRQTGRTLTWLAEEAALLEN